MKFTCQKFTCQAISNSNFPAEKGSTPTPTQQTEKENPDQKQKVETRSGKGRVGKVLERSFRNWR